ncbi:HAMP domain-containing histidine kinase [Alkalihalobacillus sp. LMS6]|uniref:sensor histidine kinase n=1 Tax=Bacillaceae TaxID=186817 RepID=UPI000C06D010|nr:MULTISPECIES: HAMP domain-containing sensor histidine kinase [Bacillaceae]UTR07809.1 HAMP domain-containing histidine kinase [Alkalihalobacillus sp. LMS6]
MIKINLTRRIWLAFVSLIVLVALSIIIVYPISIRGALTEETYQIIDNSVRDQLMQEDANWETFLSQQPGFYQSRQEQRATVSFLIEITGSTYAIYNTPIDVVPDPPVHEEMRYNAIEQDNQTGRYETTFGGQTLFYTINDLASPAEGSDLYLITYMWDTYRDEMVQNLWERLLYLLLLTSALSLLPAIWLKHYLRQPLAILENHLEQIANRNWQEPLKWEGDEDFERLSYQFERMRQNLNSYDRAQKTFIQHASHELKTPIMVIKSYAQSVKDGILPKENLGKTMDVITEEANRMERRVIDMLYYTKLDQMQKEQLKVEAFPFGKLAYQIEERFRYQRDDVTILVQGAEKVMKADIEQCEVLLENLVENGLRYAQRELTIKAEEDERYSYVIVENEGDPIDADLSKLFSPFYKGNKGKFGLGLAIVKQIAELHHGFAKVENIDKGVRFTIGLPKPHQAEALDAKPKKKDKKRPPSS